MTEGQRKLAEEENAKVEKRERVLQEERRKYTDIQEKLQLQLSLEAAREALKKATEKERRLAEEEKAQGEKWCDALREKDAAEKVLTKRQQPLIEGFHRAKVLGPTKETVKAVGAETQTQAQEEIAAAAHARCEKERKKYLEAARARKVAEDEVIRERARVATAERQAAAEKKAKEAQPTPEEKPKPEEKTKPKSEEMPKPKRKPQEKRHKAILSSS